MVACQGSKSFRYQPLKTQDNRLNRLQNRIDLKKRKERLAPPHPPNAVESVKVELGCVRSLQNPNRTCSSVIRRETALSATVGNNSREGNTGNAMRGNSRCSCDVRATKTKQNVLMKGSEPAEPPRDCVRDVLDVHLNCVCL